MCNLDGKGSVAGNWFRTSMMEVPIWVDVEERKKPVDLWVCFGSWN
jgi:hypothetical protein